MKNLKEKGGGATGVSRRTFLKTTAVSAFAFSVVPSRVLGANGQTPPSERANLVLIGTGGRGRAHVNMVKEHHNLIAFCDVDDERAAEVYNEFPEVPRYRDYRKLLEKEHKKIDGVMIATPDHTHAVIALTAMRMGLNVYCEKPLTHNVAEARVLREAARTYKVKTQMGNQGHSTEGARLTNEWIWDGAIGEVREVHTWSDRPIWPQGIETPKDTPPVPGTLDWDLWLGPAAARPYHPAYCPFDWRGWCDFGTGALGDMGCHIIDHPVWALKLGYPRTVEAQTTKKFAESYPVASMIKFVFPARGSMPAVELYWYDGGMRMFHPPQLEAGRKLPDNGVLFVGSKGAMYCASHGGTPRLIPETAMQAYKRPEPTLARVPDANHALDWVRAIKGEVPDGCAHFEYSAPLTEVMILGAIAQRIEGVLEWDAAAGQFTNSAEANQLLGREYRAGWSLESVQGRIS